MGQRSTLAAKLTGSAELFNRRWRKPWASINFVTSHDGFTLHDLVSYNEKHNEANKENGDDGHSENYSNNHGVEGQTDDTAVAEVRAKTKRAMLATLLFSQGTPMLLGGDEFGRTQGGNNNAYCQDNEMSWIDWSMQDTAQGSGLTRFVQHLTRLRARFVTLQGARFADGGHAVSDGLHDVDWFDERGHTLSSGDWQNSEGRALVLRRAWRDPSVRGGPAGPLEVTLLLINGAHDTLTFTLPQPTLEWHCLIDSAETGTPCNPIVDQQIAVKGKSVVLLANQPLLVRVEEATYD
jgi:glycogen operon protein